MNRRHAFLVVGTVAVIGAVYLVLDDSRRQDPVEPPSPGLRFEDDTIGDSPGLREPDSDAPNALIDEGSGTARPLSSPPDENSGVSEPVRLPHEFEVVFGRATPTSPLSLVHARFMSEPRNESWAAAMESGISLAIASSGPTSPITVEHVECRSTICEIAGYLPDTMGHPDLDPAGILPDDIGAGWWQGNISIGVGEHTYEGEPLARYIIIVADAEVFLSAAE